MTAFYHPSTGLFILDPESPPFKKGYVPNPQERLRALDSLILSVSGWRKIFAADQEEESKCPSLLPGDKELVLAMGTAFGTFLQKKTASLSPTVVVGIDTRFTGPAIAEILLYALVSKKCRVRYLFITPIPELLAYVRSCPSLDGFVYVSASHNPLGYNGIKFGLREGVLGREDASELIDSFLELVRDESRMGNLFQSTAVVPPRNVIDLCEKTEIWKKEAEEAYKIFLKQVISGSEDPQEQESFFKALKVRIQNRGCGIVAEFNGSARAVGIDTQLLEELGVSVLRINDTPRAFSHRIVPEGISLDLCRLRLEEARNKDPRWMFGYVPDCDGDRGNLVYFDPVEGKGKTLEAQEVFALVCVSELAGHAGKRTTPQAIVVNDPTSLRIDQIASLFEAKVFRAEVGEANVVTLAKKLVNEGFEVPLYGEGSNGGCILYPAEVRDPLATVFSILKLLFGTGSRAESFNPESKSTPFYLWCNAMGRPEAYRSDPDISTLLPTLPSFTTLSAFESDAVFPIQSLDQPSFKAAYEKVFWKEWTQRKKELEEIFGIFDWEERNYEGTEERSGAGPAFRTGKELGGMKILLKDRQGKSVAFLWMRKSGTEPVFRILVDMEGTDSHRFSYLLEWHREMIRQADRTCLEGLKIDTLDLFFRFSALIGMNLADPRIPSLLQPLNIKIEGIPSYLPQNRSRPTYISIPEHGLQFFCNSAGTVSSLFLYGLPQEGFKPFHPSLPYEISWPAAAKEIHPILGDPLETGIDSEGFLTETRVAWEIFRLLDTKIHVSYTIEEKQISRFTFSRWERNPAK
ncbi:MAG: hypothetical protein KA771_09770 [Spirochaetales bacterium]|nr:hypothetical protein [Spirochaetales bacterium]